MLTAAVLSMLLTAVWLRLAPRFGVGKAVREDGPQGHLTKAGTPTMGGLAFILSATVLALLAVPTATTFALVLLTLAAAAFGLWDDAAALVRKRNAAAGGDVTTGLLARFRLLGQGLIGLAFASWAVAAGHSLLGPAWLDVAAFTFVIVGSANAFNMTDGLDGLAAGVTVIALMFFLASPLAAALMGALLGFLWFNAHPAKVFMGGVGAEALGMAVAGLAIVQQQVWLLPLVAIVPVSEVVSVMAQVTYFRATGGKRLLKMSPLHHHFELSGWPETRVVLRFWLVSAVALLAAVVIREGVRL
jgi:phospho-N-acetylmuramoyl-pentapeptide-transferase